MIRPAENDQSKAVLPPLTVLSDTPHCSSFQFDVLMNCGNSDPAHPSYPHGRLEAARINTAVKNGKGLNSHYDMNLTKPLAILNSSFKKEEILSAVLIWKFFDLVNLFLPSCPRESQWCRGSHSVLRQDATQKKRWLRKLFKFKKFSIK